MTSSLARHLASHPEQSLADVAGTLQLGRKGFAHRRAVVCRDREDAVAALSGVDPARILSGVRGRGAPSVVLMFPGGGAQYPRMGVELYGAEPVYREVIDECSRLLRADSGLDLRAILFPLVADVERGGVALERPSLALPALFATSLATARLLLSWGVEPAAMIGHSAGEYVAACLAGVVAVEDALSLLALRGRLFETLAPGAMLSVALGAEQARAHLGPELSIAADNAPGLCVVSGPLAAIEPLEATLAKLGVEHARLHIGVAAHSAMVEPILDEVARRCRDIPFSAPSRPYVSNVTGTWITRQDVVDPRYWTRHLRGTVRFSEGLATILEKPSVVLVEVGPGRTLAALARQQPVKSLSTLSTLRHPKEAGVDAGYLLEAVGKLWVVGVGLDWHALRGGVPTHRVPLPTYPFERKRFWIERGAATSTLAPTAVSLTKRADVADWFHLPSWRRSLAPEERVDDERTTTYLVFADDAALAARLAPRLPAKAWITVVPGRAFARTGENSFEIDPAARADYDALIGELESRGLLPQRIVHLWTVTAEPSAWARVTRRRDADAGTFAAEQVRGYYSLLFLAQALASHAEPIEITVVSNHLHQLAGETSLDPAKSTLLGPCLVIPREFPNLTTRSVDVVLPEAGSREEDRMCARLAAEIASTPADAICAHRGEGRWVRCFEPVRLEPTTETCVRAGGVYLITGGLGGLGLELAAHLAKSACIKLVLVGRSPMPERSTWPTVLATRSASDAMCRKIRRVRAIEALGSEVMTASADVTDRRQMERVVADATARFGAIRGVVHAAGRLDDTLIALRPPEATSEVLAVKVQGARVLDAVLRGTPLDFFVLFSSVSAALGLPGQVDYTAANAFLDSFAQKVATRDGTHVVAIAWSAWSEVGMAAEMRAGPVVSPTLSFRAGPSEWLERQADDGDDVVFSTDVSRENQWLVSEHVVRGGEALIPGTGYLELARAARCDAAETRPMELRDVVFLAPFVVPRGTTRELRLRLSRRTHDFVFWGDDEAAPNATGTVDYVDVAPAATADLAAIAARCSLVDEALDGFLEQSFMDFGPRWGNVRRIRRGHAEALVTLELPEALTGDLALHPLHPALMDMATGGAQALIPGFDAQRDFYVPFSYGRVLVRGALTKRAHAHVTLRHGDPKANAVFDVTVFDDAGNELVAIRDFALRRADPRALASSAVRGVSGSSRQAWSGSLRENALREGIATAEGLSAFDRVLAHRGVSQIVASSIDLDAWAASVAAAARPVPTAPSVDASERAASGPPYVAPRNDVERELVGYWHELLGVARVSVHDDFFELGGQSLVAVRLFNKIRKRYGVDLPLSTLFEAPTISRCAEILRVELGLAASEPVAAAKASPHPSRWSSLVAMQPLGTRSPFYCVAGMGGNLANLRRLALLVGPDQPFYGLQPPGLDGREERLYRVEDLALHYLEQILAFQPAGPFSVGGYSGGGVAAYEVCRQLAERGHVVAFLGLLDSFSPSLPRRSTLARASIHARRTATEGPSYLLDLATRRLDYEQREATRLTTRWLGKVFPERYRYANIGDSWIIAEHAYVPGTYAGAATLFRAAEETALSLSTAYDVDEQHGWGRFVLGGVGVERCPGNHASMCEEPHVRALAASLRHALERVPRAVA
jgi:acyl transferase domain-containing protein/thioesterase domain-containing protein/aryl carrier-like protein